MTSFTAITGHPAAAIVIAVDPVETISIPAAVKPRARSANPALSYTDTSALRIWRLPSVLMMWLRSVG